MNLNQLRAFYQTAGHLSFTAAARELFITQPAVTAQVKLFEESLNLKLFKKSKGKLHLTEAGKTIYEYARKMFECETELELAVSELKRFGRGTLRIGTARTYARYFIPLLISIFRERYPHITIELREGNSRDMIRNLRDLQIEIAIIAKENGLGDFMFIPFVKEEVLLILAPDHPLARKGSADAHDIAGEPLIMKETGSGTRKLVDDLLAKNRITPKTLMETSDAEIIKLLVQHGEGISFLVQTAVSRELAEGKLASVPFYGDPLWLEVGIAYLSNQPLSPASTAFLNSLETIGINEMRFQDMNAVMGKIRHRDPSALQRLAAQKRK